MSTHETPSSSSQDGAESGDRRPVGEQSAIELGVRGLRAQDVIAVARREARVELAEQARARVPEVRRHIDALADPSSAMQEDHVSMGWHGARKLRRAVEGLRRVLAIELFTALRAIALRARLEPDPVAAAVLLELGGRTEAPGPDRFLAPELAEAEDYLRSGRFLATVDAVLGED